MSVKIVLGIVQAAARSRSAGKTRICKQHLMTHMRAHKNSDFVAMSPNSKLELVSDMYAMFDAQCGTCITDLETLVFFWKTLSNFPLCGKGFLLHSSLNRFTLHFSFITEFHCRHTRGLIRLRLAIQFPLPIAPAVTLLRLSGMEV